MIKECDVIYVSEVTSNTKVNTGNVTKMKHRRKRPECHSVTAYQQFCNSQVFMQPVAPAVKCKWTQTTKL